jgi:hypothetical protein
MSDCPSCHSNLRAGHGFVATGSQEFDEKTKMCDDPWHKQTPTKRYCPKCGGDDIWENNVVHTRLKVLEWDEDGEPDIFGEFEEVDDTIRTVTENEAERWYCQTCGEEFNAVTRWRYRQNGFGRWIVVHPTEELAWSGSRWVGIDGNGLPSKGVQVSNFETRAEAVEHGPE